MATLETKTPRPGGNRSGRGEQKYQPGGLTRPVYNSPTNPVTAGELRRALRRARNRLHHRQRAAKQAAEAVAIALEDIEKIEQALQEWTR